MHFFLLLLLNLLLLLFCCSISITFLSQVPILCGILQNYYKVLMLNFIYFLGFFSLQLVCISHKKRCLKPGDVSWNRSDRVILNIVEFPTFWLWLKFRCVIFIFFLLIITRKWWHWAASYLNAVIWRHCHS